MTANTLEQRSRELLAAEYDRYGLCGSYYITNPDMGELTGTEPDDPPISVVLSSIEAALRLSAGADAVERLDESEKDVALGQAVELAEYVERQAKGTMRDAAKRFLSLPYSQTIAARLSAGADWQPIETAPKDGSYILLTDANCVHTCLIARWKKSHKSWWGQATRSGHIIVWTEATHWQPLPAAPRHDPDDALRGDKT